MTPAEFRAEYGMSVRDVAEVCGVSTAAVYQWEDIPNKRKAQLEEHLGLDRGALGRTVSRQGYRSDLQGDPTNVYKAIPKSGIAWRSSINGELVVVPSDMDPFADVPENYEVVYLD